MINKNINGVYNAAAPGPVKNKVFMKEMRSILKPIIYLSSPELLLKAGAYFINTETELVLKSRWVVPQKLMDLGFVFKYPTIGSALKNILL